MVWPVRMATEKEKFMYPSGMRGEQMLCAIGPENLLMWNSTSDSVNPRLEYFTVFTPSLHMIGLN